VAVQVSGGTGDAKGLSAIVGDDAGRPSCRPAVGSVVTPQVAASVAVQVAGIAGDAAGRGDHAGRRHDRS
jgi:hypothetical protein